MSHLASYHGHHEIEPHISLWVLSTYIKDFFCYKLGSIQDFIWRMFFLFSHLPGFCHHLSGYKLPCNSDCTEEEKEKEWKLHEYFFLFFSHLLKLPYFVWTNQLIQRTSKINYRLKILLLLVLHYCYVKLHIFQYFFIYFPLMLEPIYQLKFLWNYF